MKVLITGLGLATSVGGLVGGAAAIRADITRPMPLTYAPLPTEGPEPMFVTGHPVRGCTDGYYFLGRWLRLAHAALDDLRERVTLPEPRDSLFWSRTGLIAAVPDDIEDRVLTPDLVDNDYLVARYAMKLVALAAFPVDPVRITIVRAGHAGMAAACKRALDELRRGALNRFLVVAVDSFVESTSLGWLNNQFRLKTPEQPAGLVPGEAGACLLLESDRAARARQATAEASVAAAVVLERQPFDAETGRGLGPPMARAVETVLREAGAPLPYDGDLFCDLNGLEHRAADFGVMLVQLNSRVLSGANLQIPAVQLGETGAASGAVAACLAVRSFSRRYGRRPAALITSRSDDGTVGAAYLVSERGEGR